MHTSKLTSHRLQSRLVNCAKGQCEPKSQHQRFDSQNNWLSKSKRRNDLCKLRPALRLVYFGNLSLRRRFFRNPPGWAYMLLDTKTLGGATSKREISCTGESLASIALNQIDLGQITNWLRSIPKGRSLPGSLSSEPSRTESTTAPFVKKLVRPIFSMST